VTREGLLIGALVLLAIGDALVIYGAFADWHSGRPLDYPKEKQ
jgi:hypothetical protein